MDQLSINYIDIEKSELFSAEWYLVQYPDVADAGVNPIQHYLSYGAFEGRDPGPKFSTIGYLQRYPDVAKASVNPLLHYLRNGRAEGRIATPSENFQITQRVYRNLAGYLKYCLLNPIVEAPFVEEDKRCFAVMDTVARWLCQKLEVCKKPPLVSIIMPVRDRARIVGEAIESVLAQTHHNFELIVIDDSSQDGSVDVVRSFSDQRLRLIENPQWIGVSAARNRGLTSAEGDIIAYLDSDNTWAPDFLAAMVGALSVLPSALAVYCGQYLYRSDEVEPSAVRFGCYNYALLRNNNYIDLNCFVHRTQAIESINGGFCEQMKRHVDWEFILKVSKVGRIYSVPIIKSNYFVDRADNTITATEELDTAKDFLLAKGEYGYQNISSTEHKVDRKVTIVVTSYDSIGSLESCIDSLAGYSAYPFVKVIVVDDKSGIETWDYLNSLSRPNLKVVSNDYAYHYTRAINQGVALADPDSDILVLSNDAVLTKGALGTLQEVAYTCSNIAITAPQQVFTGGDKKIKMHVPYADSSLPCDVALSSHYDNVETFPLFHDGSLVELNFITFFCVYIKHHVWKACGGLDVRYNRDYRSERIMCEFIRHVLGMRIVYTPDSIVFHSR
jgi:glycosyltransferase involved in cell wall biosynthesis